MATYVSEIELGDGSRHYIRDPEAIHRGELLNLVYPIGALYMSVNATDPSELFGGEWTPWGKGKVPVCVDENISAFNSVEKSGGSRDTIVPTHTHTATFKGTAVAAHTHSGPSHTHSGPSHTHSGPSHTHTGPSHTHSIPSHVHKIGGTNRSYVTHDNRYGIGEARVRAATSGDVQVVPKLDTKDDNWYGENNTASWSGTTGAGGTGVTGAGGTGQTGASGTGQTGASGTGATSSAGGHTPAGAVTVANTGSEVTDANLQPYITCYMWKRIG